MGVMPDVRKVVAVFVIARIIALDIVYPALQIVFLCRIIVFHRYKVAVLRCVRGSDYAVDKPRKKSRAGGNCGHQHDKQEQRTPGNQKGFPMPPYKGGGLFRRFGGFLRCLAGVFCGFPCGFCAARSYRLCILPLDLLLLPKPGNGVRRGKLRVVVQRLLILKIGVCLECGFFRFCRRPVGFQLAAAAALSHLPRPRPDAALG